MLDVAQPALLSCTRHGALSRLCRDSAEASRHARQHAESALWASETDHDAQQGFPQHTCAVMSHVRPQALTPPTSPTLPLHPTQDSCWQSIEGNQVDSMLQAIAGQAPHCSVVTTAPTVQSSFPSDCHAPGKPSNQTPSLQPLSMALRHSISPQAEECERLFGSRTCWARGQKPCEALEGLTMAHIVALASTFPWCASFS